MSENVVIAICSLTENVRLEWALGLKSQFLGMGRDTTVVVIPGISPVAAARNVAVKEAVARKVGYLMFWDDDIIPQEPSAMSILMATMDNSPSVSIIGGVCPIRAHVPEPVVVETKGHGPSYIWEDGEPHRVYMSGTAFLLIRLANLVAIDDVPLVTIDGAQYREYFTQQVQDDTFEFADFAAKHNLIWLVHGAVIADQIDRTTGKRFNVHDIKGYDAESDEVIKQ